MHIYEYKDVHTFKPILMRDHTMEDQNMASIDSPLIEGYLN